MAGALITCPNCRSTLSFGQGVPQGATLRCPLCETTFTVRAASAPAAAATPAKGAPTPPTPAPPVAKGGAPRPASAPAARLARPAAKSSAGGAQANGKSVPRPAPAEPAAGSRRLLVGGVVLAAVALVLVGGLAMVIGTQVFGDRGTKLQGTDQPSGPVVLNAPTTSPTMPAVEDPPTPSDKPAVDTAPTPPAPKKDNPVAKNTGDVDVADLPKSKPAGNPTPLPEPPAKPAVPEPPGKPDPEPKGKEAPTVPIVIPGTPAAPGVDAARVDAAIAKGVAYLKSKQQGDGSWRGGPPLGYAALCGLALLECQVPATDENVRKAADYVRNHVDESHQVYQIAASILFLDRLGDKQDRARIRKLAFQLLAAQSPVGGWGYHGQAVYAVHPEQMQAYLRTHWPWNAKHPRPATDGKTKDGADAELPRIDMQKLPVEELLWNKWNPYMLNPGDNSNTQFALLALWAARRHDVPVECAMLLAYERYLKTQNGDGGWGYGGPVKLDGFPPQRPVPPDATIPPGAVPPGFTPAGGMPGLRIGPFVAAELPGSNVAPKPGGPQPGGPQPGFPQPGGPQPKLPPLGGPQPGFPQPGGLQPKLPQPGGPQPGLGKPGFPQPGLGQPPMNPGMAGGWGTNTQTTPTMTCVGLLGLALGHGSVPPGAKAGDKLEDPAIQKALQRLAQHVGNPVANPQNIPPHTENLYLFWSIERVAMLYNLKTIGGKDWYGWGAQILLAIQSSDGGWVQGVYTGATPITDTCFALLFLKRSNLMADLTENLRLQMVIRDPGAR